MTVTVETPEGGRERSVSDRGAGAFVESPEQTEPAELIEDLRPRMVSLGDIADPVNVTLVDPDHFAATFVGGMRLVSVTLEVTEDGVTVGNVVRSLPWWDTRHAAIGGSPASRRFDDPRYDLNRRSFVARWV